MRRQNAPESALTVRKTGNFGNNVNQCCGIGMIYSGSIIPILKLGFHTNLHVLLWKIINDTDKILSQ